MWESIALQQPYLRPFSLRVIETRSTLAAVVYQLTRLYVIVLAASLSGLLFVEKAQDLLFLMAVYLAYLSPVHALLLLGHTAVLFRRCECAAGGVVQALPLSPSS